MFIEPDPSSSKIGNVCPFDDCLSALSNAVLMLLDDALGQQNVHSSLLLAPCSKEVCPDGHCVHVDEPAISVYEPAPQIIHTDELLAPFTEAYCPAAQLRHAFELFAPSMGENVPAGQLTHADDPDISV